MMRLINEQYISVIGYRYITDCLYYTFIIISASSKPYRVITIITVYPYPYPNVKN